MIAPPENPGSRNFPSSWRTRARRSPGWINSESPARTRCSATTEILHCGTKSGLGLKIPTITPTHSAIRNATTLTGQQRNPDAVVELSIQDHPPMIPTPPESPHSGSSLIGRGYKERNDRIYWKEVGSPVQQTGSLDNIRKRSKPSWQPSKRSREQSAASPCVSKLAKVREPFRNRLSSSRPPSGLVEPNWRSRCLRCYSGRRYGVLMRCFKHARKGEQTVRVTPLRGHSRILPPYQERPSEKIPRQIQKLEPR